MLPKDFVPPKLYIKLDNGITVELANDKPISEITQVVENLDFVKIVRCKDCKWWDADYQECKLMEEQRTYGWDDFDKRTKPDWYCADGEREESE